MHSPVRIVALEGSDIHTICKAPRRDGESVSLYTDVTPVNVSATDDNDGVIITPKAPLAITVLSPSPPTFLLQGKSRYLGRR